MKAINYHMLIHGLFLLALLPFISCNNKNDTTHTDHTVEEVYTCPMHPEIIRNQPGACPICGMDLVKKETGSQAIKNIELQGLLKPANAFVISTVPVTAITQREEDLELNVVGTVAYDARQAGAISSRVGGRIERLYVRYKYQPVKKGQRVMDIYSPELLTAQQNLLFILRNDPANSSLISAAKDRLLLMGMSATQLAQVINSRKPIYAVPVFSKYNGFITDINTTAGANGASGMQTNPSASQGLAIKEGMYVQSGQAVFTIYNQSKAWVLLDIYPEQQTLIKAGDAVRVVPETAPKQNFRAQIDYIEPIFRAGSKTLTARVYFNNTTLRIPIGSRVTANIFTQSKNAWWLPKESVVSLGRGKIVFIKEPGGFRAHKIITGLELNHFVQVLSGVAHTDSVAINAQYLVDNEAFIKANGS